MNPARRFVVALVVFAAAVSPVANSQGNDIPNVGLAKMALENDGEALAWYPSESAETESRLGPFKITAAPNGEPAAGNYPVILLSHGIGGRAENHWRTAADLARAGNVVVAPQHPSDWRPSLATRVENRAAELRAALSQVESHPALGKVADLSRVGAVGYSLGGMSVLFLAGGAPDIRIIRSHCSRENRRRDPEVCIVSWWRRAYNIAAALVRGDAPFFKLPEPVALKAIALVAPVGVLFGPDSFGKVDAAIAIHRFGDDQIVRHPFHAEKLRGLLDAGDNYYVHENAGHFAFVNRPSREALAELDDDARTIFADPPGFNRDEFIAGINRQLADFFRESLAAD